MAVVSRSIQVPNGTSVHICVDTAVPDPMTADFTRGEYPLTWQWPVFEKFLTPGAVVIDLGVHVGGFTLPAAAAGCRVLSVEAGPANIALLKASIAANQFPNVELVHAAVGERPGELRFWAHGPWGHIATPDTPDGPMVITVPAVTLDALLEARGIDRVDFIKMDIEGAEVAAVRGMTRLLARADAPAVYYESNGHSLRFFGQTVRSLKAEFQANAYRSFYIDYGRRRLIPVAPSDAQPECCVDYLAVKVGPSGEPAMPAAVADWEVASPFSRDEWIGWFRESCRADEVPAVHAHLIREFALAPEWVRADPVVSEFVDRISRTTTRAA